ncbi:MAG: hypothetical protein Q9207_001751 [Kuettlingeria erythrocarpa]
MRFIPRLWRQGSANKLGDEESSTPAARGIERFRAVIYQLNFKRALRLATRIRNDEMGVAPSRFRRGPQTLQTSCEFVFPPLHGAFNVLLPIKFQDGVQWILKVPFNGTRDRWDAESATALESECPYVLMERIDGMPLHCGWYNNELDPASLASFRERALGDIANTMVQLNKFGFDKAGGLQRSTVGMDMKISRYRKVDFFDDDILMEESNPRRQQSVWTEQGPFIDGEEYFLCSLTKHESIYRACDIQEEHTLQGQQKLLRLLIRWFFEATSEESYDFVLTHPDFDFQNILVGEDGSLKGIVDWDGAAAVPRCIGCEEYPLWLTPDWNPNCWAYDREKGCTIDEQAMVMVPDELDHYRAVYAQKIEDALRKGGALPHARTKMSGLARSLYIAANQPDSLADNVDVILDRVIEFSQQNEDTSVATDRDTTAVANHYKLDDVEATGGHLMSGGKDKLKLKVVDQISTDSLSLRIGSEDAATINSTLSDADRKVGTERDTSVSGAPTEPMSLPEPTSPTTTKQAYPDESFKQDTQSPQTLQSPTWDADSLETLSTPTAPPTVICVSFFLQIFSYFIVYMGLLQSSDISPIAASAFLLLFSNNQAVAESVALLLGGLAFGGLIFQIVKKKGHRNHEPNTRIPAQTVSDAGSLRSTELRQESFHTQQKSLSPVIQDRIRVDNEGLKDVGGQQGSYKNIRDAQPEVPMLGFALDTMELSDNLASASPTSTNQRPANQYNITSSEGFRVTMLVQQGAMYELADEGRGSEDSDTESVDREALREVALQKWAEDPLHDFGWYMPTCIYNALVKNDLDETRTHKLKVGFQRLLASLDDKYGNFDIRKLSKP